MIGESVVRQRATTTTDRYGDTILDWTTPTTSSIAGCSLAPILAGEDNDHRTGVVIGWTLYTPPDADITPTDRVVARGDTYEIDGEPAEWVSPFTGREAGLALTLRRVEG